VKCFGLKQIGQSDVERFARRIINMQERPVVVKEGGGNSAAMFAILAIVVIAAIALFVWQPWNATGNKTTNVIVQPGGQSGSSGAGTSGSGGTSGSSSGGSSSGSSSGSSH